MISITSVTRSMTSHPARAAKLEWSLATSACVLATVLVMSLLNPLNPAARAGDSVMPSAHGIGVMTLPTGEGPDSRPTECVYLLDNRNETLMIYAVDTVGTGRVLALRWVESLSGLFRSARPR
ncbi:MAG: hypothetical protein EXS15_03125 [Phycisphaerales bacterium]|nr:hypothetical protein [Phycisphaerales bacterium]